MKANIGHLEAAAGIAGLIKVVLALQHGQIPRQLHFETPNPHIPWAELPLRVVSEPAAWHEGNGDRLAGISSFGMSGTNAPPDRVGPAAAGGAGCPQVSERPQHLLTLSARTDGALKDLAGRYLQWLDEHPGADLADICYTAGAGRSHLAERAALVIQSTSEARLLLKALQQGEPASGLFAGSQRNKMQTAWLFTGQGSQYAGMARELYQTQPVFRDVLNRCDELLSEFADRSLLEVLWGEESEGLLDQTHRTQPALFSLEVALARLYQSWNLEPDVVAGHSLGQYAAACVAGVFSLEDGLKLVAARGRLMGRLPAGGGMMAVFATAGQVEPAVSRRILRCRSRPTTAHTWCSAGRSRRWRLPRRAWNATTSAASVSTPRTPSIPD